MKITPVEITNKDFKRTMRGYSTDEVDEFLDEVVEDFEALYRENANLKEKLESYNDKIQHYANLEKTLQNTLVLAQNTAESTLSQAEKEAEHIIESAKDKANAILENANRETEALKREYEKYRLEFASFKMRVLNFLDSQMNAFASSADEITQGTIGTGSLKVAGITPFTPAASLEGSEEVDDEAVIRG
ncbi:DivIVA domain-containing protein [Proteiniclasticum sp. BAD-10]|uniref:DivIVA domain-containing protein n=1 Tax=Proteiniclasticum sediminis TaxID=2804028 RepID=A0A941CMI5_9CLOT|nr:DivIVA domain-containing protein [Proteiniclasticum sediminis]MBR0575416.1 DivIVA domain-containing protein [Proteiniclasticum sediminis]